MISVISATTAFLTMGLLQTNNPANIGVMLLMLGIILFTVAYIMTSSLWFPLVIYLVFMGGILIIFIILSSVLPNENSENAENIIFLIAVVVGILIPTMSGNMTSGVTSSINGLVASSNTMAFFFLTITGYFTVVILMQKFSKSPLRNTMCQKNS